jgi:hypothetical protein
MLDTSFHFLLAGLAMPETPRVDFYSANRQVSWIIEVDSDELALNLAMVLLFARMAWACYFGMFISRFFFQIFGNIQIFGNPFFEFIYRASRLPNRMFIGILPTFYGMDTGILVTFTLFDKIDAFLNGIAIYGATPGIV